MKSQKLRFLKGWVESELRNLLWEEYEYFLKHHQIRQGRMGALNPLITIIKIKILKLVWIVFAGLYMFFEPYHLYVYSPHTSYSFPRKLHAGLYGSYDCITNNARNLLRESSFLSVLIIGRVFLHTILK